MKVAFFEVKKEEIPFLKNELRGFSLEFFSEELNERTAAKAGDADIVSVFIYSNLNKKAIEKMKKLKLITTRSTGFDHVDLKEAKKRKITVCNVPSYGENTVAEHAFALLLSLSRKVYLAHEKRAHNDFSIEELKGFDLKGKTIGVVGVGHIGVHVIRIANGFGMKVLAHSHSVDKNLAREFNFQYVSFSELLKKSDVISLHVPYRKDNHHMIGKKEFATMKNGVLLINTARGELIDTGALIKALESGKVGGAGLDVIEGEELIKDERELIYDPKKHNAIHEIARDHILFAKKNVIFTPHIAFFTTEALQRITEKTIESIKCFGDKKLGKECVVC